jgi:hypothetical protein
VVCRGTSVVIQGKMSVTDCYTLLLEGFDAILGVQWLKSLGPIVWDFAALSMAFVREGRSVWLLGEGSTGHTTYTTQLQVDLLPYLL